MGLSPRPLQTLESVTISTTATAATTTTVTAATTTTTWTLLARPCKVNGQCPATQFFAIQRIDGFLRFLRRTHGDETEPTRAAGGTIHHQVGFHDRAVRRKGVLQIIFSDVEGKVSHKQF